MNTATTEIRRINSALGLSLSKSRAEKKGVQFLTAPGANKLSPFVVQIFNEGWKNCGGKDSKAKNLYDSAVQIARSYPDSKVRVIRDGGERAVYRFRFGSKTRTLTGY